MKEGGRDIQKNIKSCWVKEVELWEIFLKDEKSIIGWKMDEVK